MTGAVLDVARSWLGTAEDPPGSNHTGISEWFADTSGLEWTRRGNPWCDMSVSKWLSDAGLPTLYCYCPTHVNAFKLGTAGTWIGNGDPQPGDVVFFDWNHDYEADHVGLVEVVNSDGTVTTIEGNVGDAVRRQIRNRSLILGFGRPNYTPTQPTEDDLTNEEHQILAYCRDHALTDKQLDSLFGPENGMYLRLLRVEQAITKITTKLDAVLKA